MTQNGGGPPCGRFEIRYRFQRHPFEVRAWFKRSLVITYAFPAKSLSSLLPPGLELDEYHGFGFLAVAMVDTCGNAAGMLVLGAAGLAIMRPSGLIRDGCWIALGLTGYWAVASLAISHWVYDVADVCGVDWVCSRLPGPPAKILSLHAGVDNSTERIRHLYPGARIIVGDFYRDHLMGEPSIREARRLGSMGCAGSVDHARLPYEDADFDLVAIIFAAHELRSPSERQRLLAECRRVLKPGARIVVVEHMRDAANFAAFGLGHLHFHSRGTWIKDFGAAGLAIVEAIGKTPFVQAFILARGIGLDRDGKIA